MKVFVGVTCDLWTGASKYFSIVLVLPSSMVLFEAPSEHLVGEALVGVGGKNPSNEALTGELEQKSIIQYT